MGNASPSFLHTPPPTEASTIVHADCVKSYMIDDTHAEVMVNVYINKEKTTTTIYCIKIDDEWYIEQ